MRKLLALLSILLFSNVAAQNPIVPGYFADPTLRKFGDTYYLYSTTDGTGNGYGPAQVWVSNDFRNWKNIVMNWPTTEVVWAPDVVEASPNAIPAEAPTRGLSEGGEKRYRYYYCRPCEVLVGESTSPVGPWHNLLGRDDAVLVPDRFVHNAITLDPQLFRDDDGQEYLYFCTWAIYKGFGCGVAKLREEGKVNSEKFLETFGTSEQARAASADSFFVEKRLIPNTELKDIFEAPYVFKRNGIYYFTYSSGSCHDHTYRVQYATSTVGPMGPFEYKGCILQTNADSTVHGPGHHSVIEQDGRYYIVYHRHNLPRSVHGFNRQVCIDVMDFDEDGNILPVVPTHDAHGVSLMDHHARRSRRQVQVPVVGVTASSYYDQWFRPEYAVDDDNATLWKAANTNWGRGGQHEEWLQLDLGKPQKFSEIWTQFEYATFFYQYKIETSLDGTHWILFADRTQNTMQGSPMIDRVIDHQPSSISHQPSSISRHPSCKARYIRITITDTQKNGHMPAIWNVKVWKKAPELPDFHVEANDAYPGMHQKDVEPTDRANAVISLDVSQIAANATAPFDLTEITAAPQISNLNSQISNLIANKPIRARVKDGRWALFFNGTQHLTSAAPLPAAYRYNSPYTIAAWVLSTKVGPVSTVASLSTSRADLATTEFRLGTDPQTGLIQHNGSFESCGLPDIIKGGEGRWQHWVITFDGWKERAYLNGQLVHEQNNFLMLRPEGHVTIGADGTGTNHFMGYLSQLTITPTATTAEEAAALYAQQSDSFLNSLGDDNFEEIDPDSKFVLSPTMKPIFQLSDEQRLSATTAAFNDSPLQHGGRLYKELEGDFVVMARVSDMEGLATHSVRSYNEVGLLVSEARNANRDTLFYQLGAFPLYNCGNMLTVLSRRGRPQYPNYTGYDFDPILQFERRGNLLFARTSRDGVQWTNMPGSPLKVKAAQLGIGVYQTTYTDTPSWASLTDLIIYSATPEE